MVVMPSLLDNYPLTIIESITNGFCFIASNVGGIPEMVDPRVLFEPTEFSLKDKILELQSIDFAGLKHRYDPTIARRTWLHHIHKYLQSPVKSPSVRTTHGDGVSVCIPFHCCDSYLPWLIQAFLGMRDHNMQLVLVNDGTPEADCPEFTRLKPKLELLGHVFHVQENKGAGAARNKAAELARYDHLLFFDADNIPFPNLISALRRAMMCTGADSIGAPFYAVPPDLRHPTIADALHLYAPPGGPLPTALVQNVLGDTCSMQRRRVFQKLGGFPTHGGYYDDWEYLIKLVGKGHTHLMYPEPLFFYRYHTSGRRTVYNEYKKRQGFVGRASAKYIQSKLKDILTVYASHFYVKQKQRKLHKGYFSPS